ncbi:MAG: hypothetical protein IKA50_00355 [Clostridia bacterium]|nr:hypothetical protein [Clostridia bacterium]
MKRILALALALTLLLCGCGGKETKENKDNDNKTADNTANSITIKGASLNIGGELTADMLKKLGEPSEKTESPNCVYEGAVYDYIYAGFSLQVNQQEGKNTLLMATITDPEYITDKDVKIGDTADAVKKAYGEATEGNNYYLVYAKEGVEVTFNLNDGTVEEIVYAAVE